MRRPIAILAALTLITSLLAGIAIGQIGESGTTPEVILFPDGLPAQSSPVPGIIEGTPVPAASPIAIETARSEGASPTAPV